MGSCYPVPFKHGNNMYFMSHNRSSTLERSVNRLFGSLNMLYCARFYLSIYLSMSNPRLWFIVGDVFVSLDDSWWLRKPSCRPNALNHYRYFSSRIDWLVGCLGLNGPLRQYFSLYRAVSQREGERKEKWYTREKMSKQPPPAPTASAVGPCPTLIQISRTLRHWKFTQHHHTTRPPPSRIEPEQEQSRMRQRVDR